MAGDAPVQHHEDALPQRWQQCGERLVYSVGAGLAGGAVAALVLSRSSGARKAIVAFGAGAGAGSAVTRCNAELEAWVWPGVPPRK